MKTSLTPNARALDSTGSSLRSDLMAGIHRADFSDVEIMKRHQQLRSQCAVVDVTRSKEKRP